MEQKLAPLLITNSLNKDELILWLGRPSKQAAFLTFLPISCIVLAIMASIAADRHLQFGGKSALELLFMLLGLFPFYTLVLLALVPLFVIVVAHNKYYVLTNKRVLEISKQGKEVSAIDLKNVQVSVSTSLVKATILNWTDARQQSGSGTLGRRRTGITFWGLKAEDVAAISHVFPSLRNKETSNSIAARDGLEVGMDSNSSLSAYLLPGETITAIDKQPKQMVSGNNAAAVLMTYLFFSSPFIAWIGIVFAFTTHRSAVALLCYLSPPIVCMVLIALFFYRSRNWFDQRLMEKRYVITNYRWFSAPSDKDISEGRWHGPDQSTSVLFADQLYIKTGKVRGVDHIDFFEVDGSFDDYENNSVTRMNRKWVRSADMAFDALPPFLKNGTFDLNVKESSSSLFERANAYVRFQRDRLGSDYPSLMNEAKSVRRSEISRNRP